MVASKEPAELVAFVSLRENLREGVSTETLRAHCQANLTPSYVPKFFVVLPELPKLPNGKSNLKELSEMATNHVVEEGEVVMDSLGQMKKLSKWAIFENQALTFASICLYLPGDPSLLRAPGLYGSASLLDSGGG